MNDQSASDVSEHPTPDVAPYAAWRSRDYRLLATSWFLLVLSKEVERVAVLVYIYAATGTPLALGWVGLVQAVPVILLAIAGGQLADRYDRRKILAATLALSTLTTSGLLLLSAQPQLLPTDRTDYTLPAIYALLGLAAVAQALGSPARAALMPLLVPPQSLSNAVAWNSTVFRVASMVGPALGGLLLGTQRNTAAALTVACVCRAVSVLAVLAIRGRPQQRQAEAVTWASMLAGLQFVLRTKTMLAAITLDLFAVLLGGAAYLMPIFANDILGVGDWGVGVLLSCEALGAVCMTLLIAHLPPFRRAGKALVWSVSAFGAATIVFGFSRSFWLSAAMMFLIGAFDNISVIVRHTLVQMLTPDHMRGRVSAVHNVFIVASNDLGGLESGVTARLFGPVASVVGGGIGTILVVLAVARRWPHLLRVGRLQDIRPADDARLPEPVGLSQQST